jgi:hypothetical protein
MDSMGHVNNAKYISYLEEARVRWMLTVPGISMTARIAPVVAANNINYRRPLTWPNDVVVELYVVAAERRCSGGRAARVQFERVQMQRTEHDRVVGLTVGDGSTLVRADGRQRAQAAVALAEG